MKIGDLVDYRKPASKKMMYMGLGGCRIVEISPTSKFEDGEQAILLEWRGEQFHARQSWLTPSQP